MMKNDIIISIIIVSYNCYNFLKNNELLKNKFSNYVEIILIDDGSTDETGKFSKNKNINYYWKKNSGYGPSLELGIKKANGKYIRILDGDDNIEISEIKNFINKVIDKKINSDCILTNYVDNVCSSNNFIKKNKLDFSNLEEFRIYELKNINDIIKYDHLFLLKTVIYKKDIVLKINFNFKKKIFANDNNYVYFPLIKINTFVYIDSIMYIYNIWGDNQSTSNKNKNEFMRSIFEVYLSFSKFFIFNFWRKKSSYILRRASFFLKWFLDDCDKKNLSIFQKIKLFITPPLNIYLIKRIFAFLNKEV